MKLSRRGDHPSPRQARAATKRKRETTRSALLETSLRLIAEKGIEGTSILEITELLGVSNGGFYYHFENKEQLLEVLGHELIVALREQIRKIEREDPARRISCGTLLIFQHADSFPEQRAIMLRVLEDPAGRHTDLGNQLIDDLELGMKNGRFPIKNSFLAMLFCRSMLASAIRLRHQGNSDKALPTVTAVHTLLSLGVPFADARKIVDEEARVLRKARASFGLTGTAEPLPTQKLTPALTPKVRGGRRPEV
jgi:AcrR family transcriptional regulator